MFGYIRRHWIAYLLGAILALALGFGAAYAVGVLGSTPDGDQSSGGSSETSFNMSVNSGSGSAVSDS